MEMQFRAILLAIKNVLTVGVVVIIGGNFSSFTQPVLVLNLSVLNFLTKVVLLLLLLYSVRYLVAIPEFAAPF